jgi:tight adherence protein C
MNPETLNLIIAVMGSLSALMFMYWLSRLLEDIHREVSSLDHRSGLPLIVLMLPLARKMSGYTRLLDFLPVQDYERWAARALNLTGLDSLFTPKEYIGSHMVLLMLGSCVPLVFLVTAPNLNPVWVVGASISLGLLLALLPFVMLHLRKQQRNEEIFMTLPYFVDLLTLLVEAGMEFTQANERVAHLMDKGPLKSEMERFARQLNLGKSLNDCLDDLRERIELDAINTYVLAMKRASKMGSPLGETLKIQSQIMRESRLRRAEALANQVAVKMLLPLIAFIFPSIFILLIGPMVIRSMAAY